MSLGDYHPSDTVNFKFTSVSSGVPFALASGAVVVWKDGSTTTAGTTEGVTLTSTFASVVGLNNVTIDLSADSTHYAAGSNYTVALSAGTVDTKSAAGYVIDEFTIKHQAFSTELGSLTSLVAEARDGNVLDQFKVTRSIVENLRPSHTGQPIGDVFFVDPVNGDTHANGNRGGVTDPYLTIQDCHDNAVTDSNHDTIILLSGAAAGATTHTVAGTTTISKRYTFIRGPGRDFIITRTGNGDTLAVTADGVELSGFQLGTAATGVGNGIQATDADFLRVENVWINDTQGDGINILRGENCQIRRNVFTDTGQGGAGEGIHIVGTGGSSNRNHIEGNTFHACAGDGLLIESGTTNQTLVKSNVFEGCTGYGVNVGASSTDAFLTGNQYGGNTSGAVNDAGTDTIRTNDEERAKHSVATEARLAELDAANIPADIDGVIAGTTTLSTDIDDLIATSTAIAAGTTAIQAGTTSLSTALADVSATSTAIAATSTAIAAGTTSLSTALADLATESTLHTTDLQTINANVLLVAAGTTGLSTAVADVQSAVASSGVVIATDAVDAAALSTDAVDEIWSKTLTELSTGIPATPSVLEALAFQHMSAYNAHATTASSGYDLVHNAAGTQIFNAAITLPTTDSFERARFST